MTDTEATGRATIFLSMLSAALIGLGFAAGNDRVVRPYLGTVLPILVIIGLVTHEHTDHVDVLRLAGLGVPVYAPEGAPGCPTSRRCR
ncbi:hypothetical protein ACLQ24_27340 [Micromonospora sp. DT4]|uniref:hypothetical protein n=1 Tax=Micromonospora sp. DT4 TaxID=3393438 RepID=UPI003CF323B2